MSDDIICPYCGHCEELCNDDGHGLQEGETHQEQCPKCEKFYIFMTDISYTYTAEKADCLNGGTHKYYKTKTYPIQYIRMICRTCDNERPPTEKEWFEILPKYYIDWGY